MVYGVVRSDGRGVPKCIEQKEAKGNIAKDQARVNLKVAYLNGDSKINGLVALSYYDSKTFYMMTNVAEKLEWMKKNRKVRRKYLQKMAHINFYPLNIM